MARILVNMPSQFGGKSSGVARVAFALLERLIARGGHDYILRSNWKRAALPKSLRTSGLEVIEVSRPGIMIADVLRQFVTVPALCRKRGIDIVWNLDPFGAARGGRARVTTVHDLYFHTVSELVGARSALTMRLCYHLVLGGSARIVVISGRTREETAALYPRLAGVMVEIANDTTLAPLTTGPPVREIVDPYVLLVGNGTPNKNLGFAVTAVARLPAQGRPILVHVGRDDDGQIAGACDAEDNPPWIVRLADVDDARLAGLYTHAVALIVPSLSEGFCLPIVEAHSLSCPVIASDASVMPEVAGEAALFFDPRDANALAARIAELMASPTLRDNLVARGHANRERYSWNRSAARYAALFDELCGTQA